MRTLLAGRAPVTHERPDWMKAEYYTRRDPSRSRPPFNKTQENARRVRQEAARELKAAARLERRSRGEA